MEETKLMNMAIAKLMLLCCTLHCVWALPTQQSDNTTRKMCTDECQQRDMNAKMDMIMNLKMEEHQKCVDANQCQTEKPCLCNISCIDGKADEYECSNVDLLSFVPLKDLGSNGDGSDIWGWTDPETGREYALVGCEDGTSFVDVTEPTDPKVVGFLPTHTSLSYWRDIKVYADHAFIGSEAANHGLQVYNLTQLRNIQPPTSGQINILQESTHYDQFGSTHNIAINEDTGYLYSMGSYTCSSGLHIVNIQDPTDPQYEACYGDDGFVHDAQCVVYKGPDTDYQGREICFCYNEVSLTIVDVEDKSNIKMISKVSYDNLYYTHQGWLMEDQSHLLLNDELDEMWGPNPNTRSLIWNVEDLDEPRLIGSFYSSKQATDHNLYIKGNLAYEANYCAGLRILDVSNIKEGELSEVGYFDVSPDCDTPSFFQGAWSNYPYFASGTIVMSTIERGLFVLKYTG